MKIETLALLTGLDAKVLRHGTILEGTASQPELGLVNKVSFLQKEFESAKKDLEKLETKQTTGTAIPVVQATSDSRVESLTSKVESLTSKVESLAARVDDLETWKREATPVLEQVEVVKARMRAFVTVAAGGSGGIVALIQALLNG